MTTARATLGSRALGALLAASLLATACGGSDDDTGSADRSTTSTVAGSGGDGPQIVGDYEITDTALTIPTISESALMLPRFIAVHDGLFEKHGLDVTVVQAPGPRGIDLFIAGEIEFAPSFGGAIAPIVASGTDVEVYGITQTLSNYSLYVRPDIESVEDLKGRTVGTSGVGGLPELTTRDIFAEVGFDADSVTYQPLGEVSAIVQAMVAGAVDAGAFGAPYSVIAEENGLRKLYNATEMGIPALGSPIIGDPAWVEANPGSAKAFLRAWLEALWIAHKDPEHAMEAFADGAGLDPVADADAIKAGYEEAIATMQLPFPDDFVLPDDRTLELVYMGFDEMDRISDQSVILPERDLVAELAEEGFFEALEAEYGPLSR